ncbi:translational activator for mitochondrial COX1 [Spiromyces aspiralis]|uniref:Translational activator for mitochondrial COX1 n=1 Tax=Spiromyces aspiralis TaxID=68401 RepID=A0ACC1HQY6_9FUNG|nr:translational activator for mitochondrial COX1 [Spiromyces aspiralis]
MGAVIHPLSPFTLKTGLTTEGLKSISAIRATIKEHELAKSDKQMSMHTRPLRLFVLGARAEAMLPPHVFLQLSYLLPHSPIHVYFVGPECIPSPDQNHSTVSVTSRLVLKFHKNLFRDAIWNFAPFDPYTDVFFLFSPGLGHPLGHPMWQPTVDKLLETKCAVYATGYHEQDIQRDIDVLNEDFGPVMDWLLEPQLNPFRSLKRDFGIRDLREWAIANWGIYAFRGKRYEVQHKTGE